ncbi:MAG: hypothetical protein VKJ02_00925 [Snowella sp.]|nr:hypothetical protein [Snowella sp.]
MEPLESILKDLRDRYQSETPPPNPEAKTTPPSTTNRLTSLDALLQELGSNLSTQSPNLSKKPATQPQSLNSDLQHFAQEQQAKRQQAIAEKAQAWLDSLDLLSGEGLWFEDFAQKYPSRLAAAIDFLACSSHSDIH